MNRLDGLIILNKPVGITSAKALYRVRSITGQRKSGHGGTLDPGASGVLILCLGRATKLVEAIMDQPKVYRATARLDVTSATFDADAPLEPVEITAVPDVDGVAGVVRAFEGEIEQVPPLVSAVKIAGQPAYRYARQGVTVELKPRRARIYWLHVHGYHWPELDFELCCGRGTYVRALIRDIGVSLGTGGCLTSLIRTRVGPFGLDDAWTLEKLGSTSDPTESIIDRERARRYLDPAMLEIPPRPVRV